MHLDNSNTRIEEERRGYRLTIELSPIHSDRLLADQILLATVVNIK